MELNKLYNIDCLEGMKHIPDGSIDLIVTDPPYEFVGDSGNFGKRAGNLATLSDGVAKSRYNQRIPTRADYEGVHSNHEKGEYQYLVQ